MNKLALAALTLGLSFSTAACSKKRLAECDAFQATIKKISNCKTLPESARAEIKSTSNQLEELFDALDQAGGIDSAPKDLQDELRDSCKSQNAAIVETYAKVAPDCLK